MRSREEKEENTWRRKIFREGKYLVHGGKKERRRKIFGEGKNLVCAGDEE